VPVEFYPHSSILSERFGLATEAAPLLAIFLSFSENHSKIKD